MYWSMCVYFASGLINVLEHGIFDIFQSIRTHTHTQHLEYIRNHIHTWLQQSRPDDSIVHHRCHLSYLWWSTHTPLHTISHSQTSINSMASYIREIIWHLNKRVSECAHQHMHHHKVVMMNKKKTGHATTFTNK